MASCPLLEPTLAGWVWPEPLTPRESWFTCSCSGVMCFTNTNREPTMCKANHVTQREPKNKQEEMRVPFSPAASRDRGCGAPPTAMSSPGDLTQPVLPSGQQSWANSLRCGWCYHICPLSTLPLPTTPERRHHCFPNLQMRLGERRDMPDAMGCYTQQPKRKPSPGPHTPDVAIVACVAQ